VQTALDRARDAQLEPNSSRASQAQDQDGQASNFFEGTLISTLRCMECNFQVEQKEKFKELNVVLEMPVRTAPAGSTSVNALGVYQLHPGICDS
jgi:hypothetical protein